MMPVNRAHRRAGYARLSSNVDQQGASDTIVDAYPLIANFFQRHLETTSLAVDIIAEIVGEAAELSAAAILEDRKLFSIGLGADCASAIALASLLQRGILRERPSLPVVELTEHHIESVDTGAHWVSQQLQALGQSGDVAVVFASTLGPSQIQQLVTATQQRQVTPVWLGHRGPGLSLYPADDSLETRLTLNHTLAVCLARLIEIHTFGPLED